MKLIAAKDSANVSEAAFSIASSGVTDKPVARWGCKTANNALIVEAANADQYVAANSLGTNDANAANVINPACTGDATTLTLTANPVPADGAIFDNKKWDSTLKWTALARSNVGAANANVLTGEWKWFAQAGATTLIATAATLYAASSMTF